MPQAVQRSLETALARIWNETAARELWTDCFTAADRRKFAEPWPEVWKKHNIIGMWHIARGTPTWNECIIEIAHALGFINVQRRHSLPMRWRRSRPVWPDFSAVCVPHWDEDARELRYLGQVVRVVKKPRRNIVGILRAFEAAGWPHRIDDPHRRKPSDQRAAGCGTSTSDC